MERNWTEEQRAAFELKNRNILVAAAAGSGKTAVLVERIIKKITDSSNPVNVDELVVVTFTKAAAAEMKHRIREAIDELVEEQPDNMHLIKQLTLINNAQITTIDSFCLSVIRNHFTEVDLDPCFRTADEGEIKLLENDVMEELLEEYYASGDDAFYNFVDAYGTGRDDRNIEAMILKLYSFARSNPWPDQWYELCLKPYMTSDIEHGKAFEFLFANIKNVLADYEALYVRLSEICREPQGPLMYAEAIESDLAGIRQLLRSDTFSELVRRTRLLSFEALGRKKIADVSENKKAYVQAMRNAYKKYINETLLGKLFVRETQEMIEDLKDNYKAVEMLIQLARDFAKRIQAEKRQRNIIDFNDMEHLALDILVSVKNGVKTYTEVAKNLAMRFDEIMIDEYQDSNLLQEEILSAVSKSSYEGENNNIYMVGDVKQSIYKFRLACPELFINKYDRYRSIQNGQSENQKIELQMNFRSRKNVLECANDVFRRVMNKSFCGIEYDEAARLNAGLEYPDYCGDEKRTSFGIEKRKDTEVVLIHTKDASSRDAREIEGAKIAQIIHELLQTSVVFDVKVQEYRPARYSDIVILTRSVKEWADVFVNELMNQDIPAYCESNAGYFATSEIKSIINYLSVIDNPTKDIQMAGTMMSYYGKFTTEELAKVRMIVKNQSLYGQMMYMIEHKDMDNHSEQGEKNNLGDVQLCKKVDEFVKQLNVFRKKSEYMSIQELVWEVVYHTGYYDYVGTMPEGKQRQANVDILLQRAGSFENTSYSGLFNFLRYVDRMKKSEVDYGEASVLGENENLVRVMSIHKSKGLEFPIVIVAGMHKKINFMDASGNIIMDQDLGIGMDVVRLNKRTKGKTLMKSAISRKIIQDTIAEEQRILYVAMTRAREKLIMTGVCKDAEKAMEGYTGKADELQLTDTFTYLDNENIKNYFDMVMPVALLSAEKNLGSFDVKVLECSLEEEIEASGEEMQEALLEDDMTPSEMVSEKTSEKNSTKHTENAVVSETDNYPPYGYETETNRKLKVTVSELKQMQHDIEMDQKELLMPALQNAIAQREEEEHQKEKNIPVPAFILGTEKKLAANERGTAYHRVMECLDYEKTETIEDIKNNIEAMVADERMTRIQADCIDAMDIKKFCDSNIGKRIAAALKLNQVRREQPFVFRPKDKMITDQLVQGVIDLYFEEHEQLVILDYKTDRVSIDHGEEQLKERYAIQLDYYAKALEQITGKMVKERIIYSFALGKSILVMPLTV